jgi:glycosyltransferase involved in cell wall biosynthesis
MEYMYFGLPIVAFDLDETRVSAGDAALYVRSESAVEFAQTLLALIDDPAQARLLGERGYERVRGTLMWEHSVPSYLEAIRAALARHGAGIAPQSSTFKGTGETAPGRKL